MDLTDLARAGTQPDSYDRAAHARLGQLTAGISPASLGAGYFDWAVRLAESPGKQGELWLKAWRKAHRLSLWAFNAAHPHCELCIEPLVHDRRFAWLERAERFEGSWWPAWQQWLAARSGERVAPPATGAAGKGYGAIADAPGRYVLEG